MLFPLVAPAAAILAQEPSDTEDPLDADFRAFEIIKGPKGAGRAG